ncbi:MAG: tetratricopeptide repeat protein, partial [Chitinivibrionales bacterium]
SLGDVPPATDNNPWPEFSRTVDIGLRRDIMNWMIAQTRNIDGFLVNTGDSAENAHVSGEIRKYLGAEECYLRAMWEKNFGKDKNYVIETLEKAARIFPGDYEFLDHLAACYREQGRFDKAIECLRAIVALHPHSVRDYTHLAMVYNEGGRMTEAREYFKIASELDPELPYPHYYLADFRRQANDLPGAIQELEQVERNFPDYQSIYSVLGVAYTCVGNYEKARESIATALRKDPGDKLALRTVQSLRKMGQF